MASPEPFVFHGGIFPFQARVRGPVPKTHVRGDVALPSVGGDFLTEDGPWDLPDIGGPGPGRITKVTRHVRGEGDSEESTSSVECIIEGIELPRVKATSLRAKLTSSFKNDLHTFEAEVDVVNLNVDGRLYEKDAALLATVQGKPVAAIRGMMAGAHAASFAPANGPGSNVACFLVKPVQAVVAASDVVVGEYSIGEHDRRLTMLRIGLPASTAAAAGAAATSSGGSVVLLQLFVNGHKPP